MLENLEKCPLCSSGDIEHFMTTKDYSISQEQFSISKCRNCALLFTNPRPSEQSIGKYYKSEDYISHSNKSNSPINIAYKIARSVTLRQKLNLINSISNKGKILDYGCGTGYFLQTCLKNGWKIAGIEPDEGARALAKAHTNHEIHATLFPLFEQKFEVITLWHVLEHVHHLSKVMRDLATMLSENGKLVIAVPNHQSYDAKVYGNFWAAYDLPRHLYHFSRKNIKQLAQQNSLNLAQILPMKFDSYYVSLLSERYKGGKNIFNSILNGYKSNIYAKKTGQYSSLIYILNK